MLLSNTFNNPIALSTSQVSSAIWHQQLGHPCDKTFSILSQIQPFQSHVIKSSTSCLQGKTTRLSFPSSSRVSTKHLQIIHCDIWGPSPTLSLSGYL